MRTAKMFWRDMCLGTFRHGARFLIIPLVVVLMTAGFAEYAANIYEAGTIAGSGTAADYYLYVMQGMCSFVKGAETSAAIGSIIPHREPLSA